jgi:hypothetical protein
MLYIKTFLFFIFPKIWPIYHTKKLMSGLLCTTHLDYYSQTKGIGFSFVWNFSLCRAILALELSRGSLKIEA